MKIDKSCYIIAAAMLIAIVATATVLSRANVALAQQPPKTAELTIENRVTVAGEIGCPRIDLRIAAEHCPQGMLTTITIPSEPGSGLPPYE